MVNFRQGEDLIIELSVLDKQNEKIDLSSASKIRVAFVIKGLTIQKYLDPSLESAISGYGIVSINSVDLSLLEIYVTREQSRNFPTGKVTANVLFENADTSLAGLAEEYVYEDIALVSKGTLKDEDLSI